MSTFTDLSSFVSNIQPFLPNDRSFAVLDLYVAHMGQTADEYYELVHMYESHIQKHNHAMMNDPFPNSGFDIFVPKTTKFTKPWLTQMIDHQIKTQMHYFERSISPNQQVSAKSSPFYLYPRSSFSKTPLMLANHTGIIDCGYRGSILGAFRMLPMLPMESNEMEYTVEAKTRLLQICHPSLCPIFVRLVQAGDLEETVRGEGGFGSSG